MGYSYLLVTGGDVNYAPLYFHEGGVQEFFGNLKGCVTLTKDKDDPNIFYTSNISEPLEKSLSSLHFSEYFEDVYKSKNKDLSWQFLELGAKVTQTAKNLKDSVFGRDVEEIYQDKVEVKDDDDEFEIIRGNGEETPEPNLSEKWEKELNTSVVSKRKGLVTSKDWISFFDENGVIKNPPAVKQAIFYGGVEESIRKEVWKYLLGLYPWTSTPQERDTILTEKKQEYEKLKSQWTSIGKKQESRFFLFRDLRARIEKDVVRTDRTHEMYRDEKSPYLTILNDILVSYAFYNFDLGYCQGMGDLLSPILVIIQDEMECFWCFANLMEKMEQNFFLNSQGMENQLVQLRELVQFMDRELYSYFIEIDAQNLYFCFRWVLVLFKREFEFEDVKKMWERVWSDVYGSEFHLFICWAVLKQQRDHILKEKLRFDEILKLCIDLSGHLNLDQVMVDAETQFLLYKKLEEANRKK